MSGEEHPPGGSGSTRESAERRRWPRAAGSFNAAIGRARLVPRVSHHYPSLRPNGWYKVVGHNPEAVEPHARPGYLWIEVDGRPRQVWAGHFEVQLGEDRIP
jgi:hypothetical protein